VYTRILAGVGAWLLGAGAATGGSLLAVSLLGRGIADSHSQQLTAAAVNKALASEAAEQSATPQATASPTPRPSPARTPVRTPASPAAASPVPSPTGEPEQTGPYGQAGQSSDGTVLSSQGGTVVASCPQAGAYLVSWSPQQGYEISTVVRGPAAEARVDFESQANSVTMVVTCSAGTPSARSYVHAGDE
jgi:hypothetical protein